MFTDANTPNTVVPMARDPFMNTADACAYLGVPKATLLTWRVRRPGYGPLAVKAGGRLKYRLSELDRWLRAHEESFTKDQEINDTPTRPPREVRTRKRAGRVRAPVLQTTDSDGVA
jgi:hypothetical protein